MSASLKTIIKKSLPKHSLQRANKTRKKKNLTAAAANAVTVVIASRIKPPPRTKYSTVAAHYLAVYGS